MVAELVAPAALLVVVGVVVAVVTLFARTHKLPIDQFNRRGLIRRGVTVAVIAVVLIVLTLTHHTS